jgi:hypothetical protein
MHTDITQGSRSQQCVTYGMYQYIRIRVTQQSLFKGNNDTADYQFAARYQPVDIISDSDAH